MRARTGYLELILCGLVWGSIGVIVKEVDVSAPVIVFFRLALGSASVVAVWALRGKLSELRLAKPRGGVVAVGIVLAVHWLAFIEAYKRMSVATTILVVYVGPVLIAALAPAVLGERLERRTLYALALSIAGILLIAVPSSGAVDGLGLFFAGVAAVLFAALVLTLKKYVTPYHSAPAIVTWQLAIAAVAVSPFLIAASADEIARAAPALVALGVFHTGLIGILYVAAIAAVQAQHVSILVYLEPVTAVVWAWAILGESPSAATLLGGVLIIAAGLLIVVPGLRGVPSPPLPEPADARMGEAR